jgi:nitrogen fixation protein NifB
MNSENTVLDLDKHPCFNKDSKHTYARVHLPVAPKCNVQCRFCDRRYDCVNESRPGVTSAILSPQQALSYLEHYMEKMPVAVAGIAGPGDPFANPEETMETLRLIRKNHPEMLLCVSSNGMNIFPYIEELAELKVSHITITVNAVDPEIAGEVYAWVRPDKKPYRGAEAGKLVVETQAKVIKEIKKHGIVLKVNSVVVPSVNEHHIPVIAKTVGEMGADMFNVIPFLPNEGCEFGHLPAPEADIISEIKKEASKSVNMMHHCTRCRADAVGLLGEQHTESTIDTLQKFSKLGSIPSKERPYVAVATHEGLLINLHLGEAKEIHVYGIKDGDVELIDTRFTPPKGGGNERWAAMADILKDCTYLLASGAGEAPAKHLKEFGITVVEADGIIEEAVGDIYEGKGTSHLKKTPDRSCGGGCGGPKTGAGCC